MWPMPANNSPVIESYAAGNVSATEHVLKKPAGVTSSPITARRLRSLKDVDMDVTVTEAQLS